jgi:tetratricopeptide (TPR) repeat protein
MDLFSAVKNKVSDYSEKNRKEAQKQNDEATYLLKLYSQKDDIQYLVKAIDIYSQLIKYYSDFIPPYLALAYISWEMSSCNEAISLLKKAVEIDPFNSNVQKMLNQYTSEIKNKKISKFSNNNTDLNFSKNLKEKVIKNKSSSKGFFSAIISIFSSSSTTKKNIVKKKSSNKVTNKTNSKSASNDFSEMLLQTSKIMQSNKKVVTSQKTDIHLEEER